MLERVRVCLNLVCELAISIFSEVSSVCVTYVSFSAIAVTLRMQVCVCVW